MVPIIKNSHDDVIKWKHFPRHWPFVRGIHRSPVNSPHNDQWRGALTFYLICAWINGWANNREAGDLRRHRAHYDVPIMTLSVFIDQGSCLYCTGSSFRMYIINIYVPRPNAILVINESFGKYLARLICPNIKVYMPKQNNFFFRFVCLCLVFQSNIKAKCEFSPGIWAGISTRLG